MFNGYMYSAILDSGLRVGEKKKNKSSCVRLDQFVILLVILVYIFRDMDRSVFDWRAAVCQ